MTARLIVIPQGAELLRPYLSLMAGIDDGPFARPGRLTLPFDLGTRQPVELIRSGWDASEHNLIFRPNEGKILDWIVNGGRHQSDITRALVELDQGLSVVQTAIRDNHSLGLGRDKLRLAFDQLRSDLSPPNIDELRLALLEMTRIASDRGDLANAVIREAGSTEPAVARYFSRLAECTGYGGSTPSLFALFGLVGGIAWFFRVSGKGHQISSSG